MSLILMCSSLKAKLQKMSWRKKTHPKDQCVWLRVGSYAEICTAFQGVHQESWEQRDWALVDGKHWCQMPGGQWHPWPMFCRLCMGRMPSNPTTILLLWDPNQAEDAQLVQIQEVTGQLWGAIISTMVALVSVRQQLQQTAKDLSLKLESAVVLVIEE